MEEIIATNPTYALEWLIWLNKDYGSKDVVWTNKDEAPRRRGELIRSEILEAGMAKAPNILRAWTLWMEDMSEMPEEDQDPSDYIPTEEELGWKYEEDAYDWDHVDEMPEETEMDRWYKERAVQERDAWFAERARREETRHRLNRERRDKYRRDV